MENGFNAIRDITPGTPMDFQEEVSFAEGVKASLAYKYVPAFDYLHEVNNFPDQPENGYIARDNISDDMLPYANTLLRATSPEHMDYLMGTVKKGIKTRQTLESAGLATQFAAELFDPFNYIGIPFVKAGSFGYRALRGSVAPGFLGAAQESIRDPFDPVGTGEETAMNIGSAFVMGGLLSGLVTIPMQRRVQAQIDAEAELNKFKTAMAPVDGEAPDASIASSMFTDSWLYNAVTTPMKRILQSKNIPNEVKLTTLKIANDSGVLLEMNRKGQKVGNSVFQNAKQFEGEWVALQADMMPLWGESTGKGVVSALDYTLNRSGYESWLQAIDRKAIKGEAPTDAIESQVMEKINNFYRTWETRLGEQGLIGSKASLERVIKTRETRIAGVQKRLEGKIGGEYRAKLEAQLRRYEEEIEVARANIEDLGDSAAIRPPNENLFRPRYFDLDAIVKNREAFEDILKAWFKENPQIVRMVGPKFTKTTLPTDDKSIALRAKEATDNILGMKDVTDPEMGYYGAGKSKHFKHRALDIPNELVIDFIQTNPVAVMKAYTQRVGPRYEFARQFNGASIDDVLDDVMTQMMDAGKKPEQAYAAMKDIRHLYRRVTGGVLRDPDSWDQTTAKILRDLATLNYLGKAGVATLTEPAKIMMEHGVGTTMRALFGVLNDNKLKLASKEVRLAGEALDNIMNSAHLRLTDDLNNNPFKSDIFDKMKNPFFLLNGLGPITKILKDFDAMVRSHTLIDYSVRWTQGKATKMEQEYLLRYNIDLDAATRFANAPWQKSSDGLYYANTEAWTNTIEFPATTADIISGPTNSFQLKKVKKKITPEKGFARKDIVNYLNDEFPNYDKGSDLAFHATDNPKSIIDEGFETGGATIDYPHFDYGYGDYIVVFDIRDVKKEFNVASNENLKTRYRGRAMEPEHDSKFASDMYGDAGFALKGKKPIAVIHVSEIPEFGILRRAGARAEESGISGSEAIEAEFYAELQYLALKGDAKAIKELDGFGFLYGDPDDPKVIAMAIDEYQAIAKEKAIYKDYKPLENLYEEVTENGRYKPAFYREEDNSIYIDEDYIRDEMYPLRGWEDPRVEGVRPLKAGLINSPDDYVAFIKMHEIMHSLNRPQQLNFKVDKNGKVIDEAGYENAINDLAVAEIEKQARVSPDTVRDFRSALSSGVLNTILMGTPADKPIISDGIAYVPMRVARKFGMKEDPEFTGYARIENGLLAMPFQFYSYSLASVNKVAAAYAHGQLKDQFLGTLIAMGLGYMTLELKTPDFVDLSFQDKLARSFDYSGIAALYSDMMYTAMSTSLALGGPNLTGGILEPRFPQKPDGFDAFTGIAGAGASTADDIRRGIVDIATGNAGEGVGELIDSAPMTGLFMVDGMFKAFGDMLENTIDGEPTAGFKRY